MFIARLPGFLLPLPLFVLSGGILIGMIGIAVARRHFWQWGLTIATLLLALGTLPVTGGYIGSIELFRLDSYSKFYTGLILAASAVVVIFSYPYVSGQLRPRMGQRMREKPPEEYYLLILLGTLGAAAIVISAHFASFFLGLEILSTSLYVLMAYQRESRGGEAAIKYLVLAGVSSAFLLFGIGLLYTALGVLEYSKIAGRFTAAGPDLLSIMGTLLLLVGVGFKLALVPFHMAWPDVYEGASAPVTAFIATVSKAALFAFLFNLFLNNGLRNASAEVSLVFAFFAVASMFVGNLLALKQESLKRLLGCSAIAQLGYLSVALLVTPEKGAGVIAFYLMSYIISLLASFGVMIQLSTAPRSDEAGKSTTQDLDLISDYQGLFWSRPFLASLLAAAMLSLAGIPLTIGFISKFYLVFVAVGSALWSLAIILTFNSAISLYYYLRVIYSLFKPASTNLAMADHLTRLSYSSAAVLALLAVALIGLGIYPTPFVEWVQSAVER